MDTIYAQTFAHFPFCQASLGVGMVDSLCCGKATAVASVHRTLAKCRLSNPPSKYPYQKEKHHPLGWCFLFGGGWWIRTTEGIASRFTVCPLWPLGKSPIFNYCLLEPVDGLVKSRCGSVQPSPTTLIRVVFHFRVFAS